MNANASQYLLKKVQGLEEIGIKINAVSVSDLFEHYAQVGFVYDEKKRRIVPHLDLIKSNWELGMRAKNDILWVFSYEKPDCMATVTAWRATNSGMVAQHLTSTGAPNIVRVLLPGALALASIKGIKSLSFWFSPSNRYSSRVFGAILGFVGHRD